MEYVKKREDDDFNKQTEFQEATSEFFSSPVMLNGCNQIRQSVR